MDSFVKGRRQLRKQVPLWTHVCKETSIHGLKHVADSNSPLIARLFWASVILASALFASYLVLRSTFNLQRIDSLVKRGELGELPLPAITICNGRIMANVSTLQFGTLVCGRPMMGYRHKGDQEHTFCTASEWNCSKAFIKIYTSKGLCYTFNLLSADQIFRQKVVETNHLTTHDNISDWNVALGYLKQPYPLSANDDYKIAIYDRPFDNITYCRPSNEMIVLLHRPDEFPVLMDGRVTTSISNYYTSVVLLFESRATTSAEDMMEHFSPSDRYCYYHFEIYLRYFKHYTYNNCLLECLTNFTENKCGCIDYFMPRDTNNTIYCNNRTCVDRVFKLWKDTKPCKCLPDCDFIEYRTTGIEKEEWNLPESLVPNISMKHYFMMRRPRFFSVKSSEPKYTKTLKFPVFTYLDFVANVGGILSLFCGLSLISIVECFYFVVQWCFEKMRLTREDSVADSKKTDSVCWTTKEAKKAIDEHIHYLFKEMYNKKIIQEIRNGIIKEIRNDMVEKY